VDDYLPIVLLLAVGLLFASLSFLASGLLGPRKRPTAAKTAPYECGIVPELEPPTRFPVRFYLVAMIFIIFDIEIIFLYPWAVIFRQLGSFGLVEVVVFAAVVFVSFLFLVSNGALTWGPAKRLVDALPSRTSTSTILRISGRAVAGEDVPIPTGVAAASATAGAQREPAAAGVPGGPDRAA
jgi:NADH-quinone oxidoreductase subunit A